VTYAADVERASTVERSPVKTGVHPAPRRVGITGSVTGSHT
jgi:hypothetical protein